jgi:aminopeptidase N
VFPAKYKLCSTGEINLSKNNEKNTAKISARAVRDFAMCLSSNAEIKTENAGSTKIFYMGYSEDKNTEKYLKIAKEALEYFNELFGKYPYGTLTVAKTPFGYGGMEYPNIVFISDAVDDEDEYLKVIVHEIAHQWWYGVVGNDEVNEAWLDETLAEYSTALFFDKFSGYGIKYEEFVADALSSYLLYVDVISTLRGDVNTKMNLPVNEYQNDYEYSYMVYVKGVIMFDSLSQIVGKKKIVQGLKKYYAENKFKIADK